MYKIGVIGDFENTAYFKTAGVITRYPKKSEDAKTMAKELIAEGCGVIFVSDKYYREIDAEKYQKSYLPAIIALPIDEDLGIGRDDIGKQLNRAAGLNII